MFQDFSLIKKPTSKIILDEIRRMAQMGRQVNPFKFKPGECPICFDGQPGCPRCFTMPCRRNGDPARPVDFEFNPDVEQQEAAQKAHAEEKRLAVGLNTFLIALSLLCIIISRKKEEREQHCWLGRSMRIQTRKRALQVGTQVFS
jgi:hypothetical protein